jgi:hypothetical protein
MNWKSAQSSFRADALILLGGVNYSNWEQSFYKLLVKLSQDDDLDSYLKYQLAMKILEIGCRGSYCWQLGFQKMRDQMLAANIDGNANWISPDDADADRARRAAQELLERLGMAGEARDSDSTPFKQSSKESGRLFMELRKRQMLPQYSRIGWVYRDSDRIWTCSVKNAPSASNEPFFVLEKKEGGVVMTAIGTLKNGSPTLNPDAISSLVEGRVVFLEKVD